MFHDIIIDISLLKLLVVFLSLILESSDDGPREGLSESDGEQNPLTHFHGLLKGKTFQDQMLLSIKYQAGEEVLLEQKNFRTGDFICEYAACVKPQTLSIIRDDDRRYESLGLGYYALYACHDGQWHTFDATGKINDPGRFINHASRNNNLILMKPIHIGERLRIGFVAKNDIEEGEELFYNYGIGDKDIPWLISDGKAMSGHTTQSSTAEKRK